MPAGGAANMKAKIFLALVIGSLLLPLGLRSQTTPATVVVAAQVAAPAVPVPARDSGISSGLSLKFLQEMKAANDATLKAQAAQLAALDELQKAAEEIKIYSKRG